MKFRSYSLYSLVCAILVIAITVVSGLDVHTVESSGPSIPTVSQLGNPVIGFIPSASSVNGGGASDGDAINSVTLLVGGTATTEVGQNNSTKGTFNSSGFGNNSVPSLQLYNASDINTAFSGGGRLDLNSAAVSNLVTNLPSTGQTVIAVYYRNASLGGGNWHQIVSFVSKDNNGGDNQGTIDDSSDAGSVFRWPQTSVQASRPAAPYILTYTSSAESGGNITENFFVNGSTSPVVTDTVSSYYSGISNTGHMYFGGSFGGKFGAVVVYNRVLTTSERATAEGALNNYFGIDNYIAPNVALIGNNVISAQVGTLGRQTTVSLNATPSSGGTGSLTYQWYRSTNATATVGQIISSSTHVGGNSTSLNDIGLTAGTDYYYALKTTDGANATVQSTNVFHVKTAGTKLVRLMYGIDSTAVRNDGFGNDVQYFQNLVNGLDSSIAFADDPYTANNLVGEGGVGGNHPYPSTNYGLSGSPFSQWVNNGGNLDLAIANEQAKGSNQATVFFFSGLYNDVTALASSSTVVGYLHTAVQKLSSANINLYLNLPWEWSGDSSNLIEAYRAAILADTYDANSNPYGLIGNPHVLIGDQANINASLWGGNLHPDISTQNMDIAMGNWASAFVTQVNAHHDFFGLLSISSVTATPNASGAIITWNSNVPATSQVDFGTSTGYGSSVIGSTATTSHSASFSNLTPNTYHFRITATDLSGNSTTTSDHTFVVENIPTPVTEEATHHRPSSSRRSVSMLTNTLNPVITSALTPIATIPFAFSRNLTLGSIGEDVRQLQIYLNSHGFPISLTGAGSQGYETSVFGGLTRAALAKFQAAHAIIPSVGYFGLITKSYIK